MHTVIPASWADVAEQLPGQDTLVASWRALARLSPGAYVGHTASTVLGLFPHWTPLNNAIVLGTPTAHRVASAFRDTARVYLRAGVAEWALWLPSPATTFDGPDVVAELPGLRRDTTTLVMSADLPHGLRLHEHVARTSVASATAAAGERPVPSGELEPADPVPGLSAWVMVVDGVAVAGAWSYLRGIDCGIYAVGTLPRWRRRGLARALMEHVLADAARRGATTATLQSSVMGRPLYSALGFRAVGRYEEWVPA